MSTSHDTQTFPSAAGTWVPADDQSIAPGAQPIFKLHGSCNWRTAEGSDIMILGGGKMRSIEQYPVLQWYSKVFAECLDHPLARLMVIGYGFRDDHINETIQQSMNNGMKLFLVDPLGAEAASSLNTLRPGDLGYSPTKLENAVQESLIGASRRPLSSTFAADEVERRKVDQFFLT